MYAVQNLFYKVDFNKQLTIQKDNKLHNLILSLLQPLTNDSNNYGEYTSKNKQVVQQLLKQSKKEIVYDMKRNLQKVHFIITILG